MNKLYRLCAATLAVFGSQACQTTGGGPADTAGMVAHDSTTVQSAGQTATQAQAAPGAQGELVPASIGLPPDPGPRGTYRIGPHDLLQIEVFQVEELSSQERVSEEGFIVMSLIGAVPVGGLTPKEAEEVIAAALGRSYLQNPQVNVFVSEYASQDVTVTGAVNRPGVFPMKGRTTLLQAIAQAEGVDPLANEEEIIIFRSQARGGAQAYVVNLEKIQEGALQDPLLVANDRVVVAQSGGAVFFKGLTDTLRGFVRLPIY
ncbi:MAG: polysaccharide biosynthesis/export family protein [Pseudomonadota bacterium]|nr:polysaccharide biosynthesis/export family protein [Pseudomonadota bacterium]